MLWACFMVKTNTLNALSDKVGLTLRPQRAGFKLAKKLLDDPPLKREREVLFGVERPELLNEVAVEQKTPIKLLNLVWYINKD